MRSLIYFVFFQAIISCAGQALKSKVIDGEKAGATEDSALNQYIFFLDGEPIDPPLYSLNGTTDKPQEGDVIRIEDVRLTIGPPGTYRFKNMLEDDGRLLLMQENGVARMAAVIVDKHLDDESNEWIIDNPLDELTNSEIAEIRGIYVHYWSKNLEKQLKRINPAKTFITLTDETARGENYKMPPIPQFTEYLHVLSNCSDQIENFSLLKKLTSLKYFSVDSSLMDGFDVTNLENNKKLRYLDFDWADLVNFDKLANLPELRSLSITNAEGVYDLTVLRKLKNLRSLFLFVEQVKSVEVLAELTGLQELVLFGIDSDIDISFIKSLKNLTYVGLVSIPVDDLTPLEGLELLVEIDASYSPIKKLPMKNLPALRKLSIFDTLVSDDEAEAFSKAFPQVKVLHQLGKLLKDALVGTDRMKVFDGYVSKELILKGEQEPLYDESDPAAINDFISHIIINEKKAGSHCMCLGNPTLAFYHGDEIKGVIRLHHGTRLDSNDWPYDGVLTAESAAYITAWLKERGIEEPKEELEQNKKMEAAAAKRQKKYLKILPKEFLDAYGKAETEEEIEAAFEIINKNAVKMLEIYLRLFGCDDGSWSLFALYDWTIRESMLPSASKSDLSKAVENLMGDSEGMMGVARWLLGENQWETVDAKVLEKVLPEIAMMGLTHPRKANRWWTFYALGEIKSKTVTGLLRNVLDEKVKIRLLKEEDEDEPNGILVGRGTDYDMISEECLDSTFAAYVLAKLGDIKSLKKIMKLAAVAEGEDKKVLDKAVQILNEKKKEKEEQKKKTAK